MSRKTIQPIFKPIFQNIFKPVNPNFEPRLVFTFDDGSDTDYSVAFPMMKNYGIKGTSYITTSLTDTDTWLNKNQILEMHNEGWDIQCHSHTHPSMENLTQQQIMSEMETVNSIFTEMGLPTPIHHALPGGGSNDLVVDTVLQYRLTCRKIFPTNISYFPAKLPVDMRAISIDTRDAGKYNDVKKSISIAFNEGKTILLYGHRIVSDPQAAFGLLDVYFEGYLEHISKLGIRTLTISELYNEMNI